MTLIEWRIRKLVTRACIRYKFIPEGAVLREIKPKQRLNMEDSYASLRAAKLQASRKGGRGVSLFYPTLPIDNVIQHHVFVRLRWCIVIPKVMSLQRSSQDPSVIG